MIYCTKCKIIKSEDHFSEDKSRKNGYSCWCKECRYKISVNWYKKNKEYQIKKSKKYYGSHSKEIGVEFKIKYRANHDFYLERAMVYKNKNRESINKKQNEVYGRNPKAHNKRAMRYLENNINAQIAAKLRKKMNNELGRHKLARTSILLGCTIEFFKNYIELKMIKGMSWENHGLYTWHLDHIKPCKLFDLAKLKEQKKCFHYTNLQPLWAKDNLSKNAKYRKD